MNRRRMLLVLAVLALLLLGWALWVFLMPKPAPPPQTATPPASAQDSARKSAIASAEGCCEIVPNPELKDQGRVVVAFPEGVNVSGTTVYVYPSGAEKQVALNVAGGAFSLAPGAYDVEIQKVRLSGVKVEAGRDTRVRVGALRVSAGNDTAYQLLDATRQQEIGKGFGQSAFGLPVGTYSLRVTGQIAQVAIEDGKITDARAP